MYSQKMNSISKMNEICQKNDLSFTYRKLPSNSTKNSLFVIKLTIVNNKNKKTISYQGTCPTVKGAKHSAAKYAIKDDFLHKLKGEHRCDSTNELSNRRRGEERDQISINKFTQPNEKSNQRKQSSKQSIASSTTPVERNQIASNQPVQSSSNQTAHPSVYDVRAQTADNEKITSSTYSVLPTSLTHDIQSSHGSLSAGSHDNGADINSSKNYLYDLYLSSKQSDTPIIAEFVESRKNGTELVMNLRYGIGQITGSGASEIGALQDCAKRVDFKSCINSVDYFDSDGEIEGSINTLTKIHLQTGDRLESKCLLSMDRVGEPMYVIRCKLGNSISYGIHGNKERAQDLAASYILKGLRSKLEDQRVKLYEQLEDVKSQILDLDAIIVKMDETKGKSHRKRSVQDDDHDSGIDYHSFDLRNPYFKKEKILSSD